jgi:hypothetical protein
MTKSRVLHVVTTVITAGLFAVGCGADGPGASSPAGKMVAKRRADGTIVDDRALCDFKNRKDVEVSETAGVGAMQPNVRRVWKVFGTGADRRKILICREVDTNLDGFKDVVRIYTDDGQSKEERADTNFDGKLDTWNLFAKGRLAEVRLDKNFDGEVDEWKVYIDGKLSRVKRDSNFDKKADTWEMYRKGRLERMGVDLDGDQRVDRWDHDTEWQKKLAAAEQRRLDEEQRKKQEDAERRMKEAEDTAAKTVEDEKKSEGEKKDEPKKDDKPKGDKPADGKK